MPGCIDCKHHKSEYPDNYFSSNSKVKPIYSCAINNDIAVNDWWEENKNRRRNVEGLTDMECHEDTDIAKSMDKMSGLLDKMNDLLSK